MSTVPACVLKAASQIVNTAKRPRATMATLLGWKGPAEGEEGIRPIERWSITIRLLFFGKGICGGSGARRRCRRVPIRATLRLMDFAALCRRGTGNAAFPNAGEEIEQAHLAAPLGQLRRLGQLRDRRHRRGGRDGWGPDVLLVRLAAVGGDLGGAVGLLFGLGRRDGWI